MFRADVQSQFAMDSRMTTPGEASSAPVPWWRLLNRYHWFVLIVAALGWLLDCLDQQLFNIARVPAMRDLLNTQDIRVVSRYGGYATAIFLMGWATGGLVFGILGDRIGRAKTMLITILIYSLCTGLSALSVGFWDFAFYRFLTGLGVGGEFAVGVALVAEVMPDRARPYALGLLQALSTVGNVTAAVISMGLGYLEQAGAMGILMRGESCSSSARCPPFWPFSFVANLKSRNAGRPPPRTRGTKINWVLMPNYSAIRVGAKMRSLGCCSPLPVSSVCGEFCFLASI